MVVVACFSSSSLSVSSSLSGRVKTSCILFSNNGVETSKERHTNDLSFKFGEASKRRNNLIPVYKCVFSDQLTPVLAYRSLVKENHYDVPSFLFDHVGSASAPTSGRYSVVGAYPAMEIIAKDNNVTVLDHLERQRTEESMEDPMLVLQRIMQRWNPKLIQELPNVFTGGWVGYFGYNSGPVDRSLPYSSVSGSDRNFPDIHLGLYDDVVVFDHVEKKIYAIHWVQLDQFSSKDEAVNDGKDRLDNLLMKIHNMVASPTLSTAGLVELDGHSSLHQHHQEMLSIGEISQAYKKAISKATNYIMEGDVAEFALGRIFKRRTLATPFEVYRTMRTTCPSNFMTYLQARGSIMVASGRGKLTSFDNKATNNLFGHPYMLKRNRYGGGYGSISFSGDMNICQSTQSIVFSTDVTYDTMYSYDYNNNSKRREWIAQLQAGATSMANIDMDDKECKNKAFAFAQTIDIAESSFTKKAATSPIYMFS